MPVAPPTPDYKGLISILSNDHPVKNDTKIFNIEDSTKITLREQFPLQTSGVYIKIDTDTYKNGKIEKGVDTWVNGTITPKKNANGVVTSYDIKIENYMFNITVPQMNMLLKYVEISLKNGPIGGKRTTRRGKKVSHRKKHTQRKQRK